MHRLAGMVCLVFTTTLLYAQEAPPAAAGRWSGNLAAGLTLTRGNSDTKNFSVAVDAARRISARNVAKYDAFYLRADSAGALTVDRTAFGGRDELTVSPLTYAFGDLHFLRDRFKKIESLITPTVGAGHHLIKTAATDLAVEACAGGVIVASGRRGAWVMRSITSRHHSPATSPRGRSSSSPRSTITKRVRRPRTSKRTTSASWPRSS